MARSPEADGYRARRFARLPEEPPTRVPPPRPRSPTWVLVAALLVVLILIAVLAAT